MSASAILGYGVLIPIDLFNQRIPGIFQRDLYGGYEISNSKLDALNQSSAFLKFYITSGGVFITTAQAYVVRDGPPEKNIDFNRLLTGHQTFHQYLQQTFPGYTPSIVLVVESGEESDEEDVVLERDDDESFSAED